MDAPVSRNMANSVFRRTARALTLCSVWFVDHLASNRGEINFSPNQ
jgi:hypothetical protein